MRQFLIRCYPARWLEDRVIGDGAGFGVGEALGATGAAAGFGPDRRHGRPRRGGWRRFGLDGRRSAWLERRLPQASALGRALASISQSAEWTLVATGGMAAGLWLCRRRRAERHAWAQRQRCVPR